VGSSKELPKLGKYQIAVVAPHKAMHPFPSFKISFHGKEGCPDKRVATQQLPFGESLSGPFTNK